MAFNRDNSFEFGTPPISSTREQTQSDADTISQCDAKFSESDDDAVIVLSDEDADTPKTKKKKKKITDYYTTVTATRSYNITSFFDYSRRRSQTNVVESVNTETVISDQRTASSIESHISKNKRKASYTTYSLRQKLEVLDFIKTHSEADAARHFSIPRTTLRSWKGLDMLPKEKAKSTKKGKHARKGSGRPLSYSPDIEEQIVQWVLESRDLQIPIQRKMIQQKALALISPNNPQFRASEGWLQKFMKRNSLSLRKHTSVQQKLPADLEKKLESLLDEVKILRERHNFSDELIINMDETPVFFDMPRQHTIHTTGAKEVRVSGTKGGKRRITYVVSCTASGQMLKPMVIFKGKTKRSISKIAHSKGMIFVTFQQKAWMDENLMQQWIKEVLLKYSEGRHCLLLLDSFRAHLTDKVSRSLNKANATVVIIPGGCTSKVQPVDVCLNKPIKDTIRGHWEEFMMQKATKDTCGPSNSESAYKTDIADWIVQANSLLSSQSSCVKKSFKVCGISSSLDGSENHLIRCAKELPEFSIPYGPSEESDEDIFDDSETDSDISESKTEDSDI